MPQFERNPGFAPSDGLESGQGIPPNEANHHHCECATRGSRTEGRLCSVHDLDEVNHPSHYRHPSGVECITVVEHMSFLRGNAMKYLWRAGEKSNVNVVTDLRKAIWYIQRDIEKIEREA